MSAQDTATHLGLATALLEAARDDIRAAMSAYPDKEADEVFNTILTTLGLGELLIRGMREIADAWVDETEATA